SRQNIPNLPVSGDPYESALQVEKGAYIVEKPEGTPDVVLVASGSEVATLTAGAKMLKEDGIKIQIVSAPSEGLFRNQPADYQESVLPAGIPRFGLTAGLPDTLSGLVGENGRIWGMASFGFSA